MTSNTQQVPRVWDSAMGGAYAKHLKNYSFDNPPYDLNDVREIGLQAYAMHEEDKKVRSGLVTYYGGLTTITVANAILDAAHSGNAPALQAAAENLIKRGDATLLLKKLFEAGALSDYMDCALAETLQRNNAKWLLWVNWAIKVGLDVIQYLDRYFSQLTPSDILHMSGIHLESVITLYKELGEETPRDKIRELTKDAIEKIKGQYPNYMAADFFGLISSR